MSNQRDQENMQHYEMVVVCTKLFKYAKEVLESEGHEDAAFSTLNKWKHGCVKVNHCLKIHARLHTH